MPVEVRVPALGESVVEATVGAWLKKEGAPVAAGETLVQLETEKVNVEVAAERAGVLAKITRQVGETVGIGDVLATLGEAGETTADGSVAEPVDAASGADGALRASPMARRLAAERGVDLGRIEGSGPAGRVMAADVEHAPGAGARGSSGSGAAGTSDDGSGAEPPSPYPSPRGRGDAGGAASPGPQTGSPALPPADAREERVRMSRRRQVIAQRLVEAQRTAAMLTTFNEVDMSAVRELRTRRRDAFKERHGVGLGFMSFFTKAVVGALKAFPNLNAEIQGEEIVRKHYYDIGIAVGAEGGLVVPVVRAADRKSFAEIERDIGALAEKARTNTLAIDDLRGGTFTITNGGVYGSLMSTPILNPPQVGILGMHKIQSRPVAIKSEVAIRPMMYLALSYDHRLVDGREAVQFLVRVKELIEDPEQLLLEG